MSAGALLEIPLVSGVNFGGGGFASTGFLAFGPVCALTSFGGTTIFGLTTFGSICHGAPLKFGGFGTLVLGDAAFSADATFGSGATWGDEGLLAGVFSEAPKNIVCVCSNNIHTDYWQLAMLLYFEWSLRDHSKYSSNFIYY